MVPDAAITGSSALASKAAQAGPAAALKSQAKRNLLYVDDQRENLIVFRAAFEDQFNILEASSATEALQLLEVHEIPVVVTDQRMPDMTGVELCEIVKREYPHTIRLILTGYTDSDAIMEAINTGHVYSFITKPWERETLYSVLVRVYEAYDLAVSNNALTERLEHAERCAVLGRCAAGIAHEMRNQLFILPLLELIDDRYQEDAELRELARVARLTHDRLKDLIDEVKNFVHREDEDCHKMLISLGQVIREAVSLASLHETVPKRALRLDVRAQPTICGHPARIQQVIFNLVKNAADALRSRSDPEIIVALDEDEAGAVLSVRDNGPGIEPANLERIWEPFFTTKGSQGTGLGLDLCRRIIAGHGGSIACQSQPGVGTVFTIRLPKLTEPQAA